MPEPVNPKLDPRPSQLRLCVNTGDWWARVDASDDVCLHARCEGEHRTYIAAAWLASDEAVERVAGALAGPAPCHCSDDPRHTLGSVRCPQHGQGEWPRDRHRTAARAVLAALRGEVA